MPILNICIQPEQASAESKHHQMATILQPENLTAMRTISFEIENSSFPNVVSLAVSGRVFIAYEIEELQLPSAESAGVQHHQSATLQWGLQWRSSIQSPGYRIKTFTLLLGGVILKNEKCKLEPSIAIDGE